VQRLGDRGRVPNLAALLAHALFVQGRDDEAEEFVNLAGEALQSGDRSGEAFCRMAEAQLLVRRGATDEAVALARQSASILEETQEFLTVPDLLMRQAEVFRIAGLGGEARSALQKAIELYERKGALAGARQAGEQLGAVGLL
jgi:ATP/maltotriose-dependent transcriptional regulator MalT